MTSLTNDPTRDMYEQRLRENPRACPHCGSRELLKVKPKHFAMFDDRRCKACGCQWTPVWPKAAAFALMVLFAAEVGGSGYLVWLFTLGEFATWTFARELAAGFGILTLVALITLRQPLRFTLRVLGGQACGPRVHGLENEWLQGGAAGPATAEAPAPPAEAPAPPAEAPASPAEAPAPPAPTAPPPESPDNVSHSENAGAGDAK